MKTKNCENCGKEFTAKRDDAKYCCSTCRHEAWAYSKQKENKDKEFISGLKGIVNDGATVQKETVIEKIPNLEHAKMKGVIQDLKNELNLLIVEKKAITSRMTQLKRTDKGALPLAIGATGAFLGYSSGKHKTETSVNKRLLNTTFGAIIGLVGGHLIDKSTKESRENAIKIELSLLEERLNELNVKVNVIENEKSKNQLKLLLISPYIEVEKEVVKANITKSTIKSEQTDNLSNPGQITQQQTFTATQKNVIEQKTDNSKTFKNAKPNSKIMSSTELTNLQYFALNFQERWQDFLGQPSTNFHCAIHGMPGEGKSTFAIQFANYLAENFGSVVYVSGEEGFAKTMKDKLNYNNAHSPNLSIADLRTKDELLAEIEPNTFNFIFIDSLDNMRINAVDMKEIKTNYANSALITISQSTKDGKMRGSLEIIHDADISIAVSNGVAETTKNRFLEKGKKFNIFTNRSNKTEDFLPDNTVNG